MTSLKSHVIRLRNASRSDKLGVEEDVEVRVVGEGIDDDDEDASTKLPFAISLTASASSSSMAFTLMHCCNHVSTLSDELAKLQRRVDTS